VVNDFNGKYAFINYVNYGSLQVLDVCLIGTPPKRYQQPDDSIRAYLNHNKERRDFKEKTAARAYVKKLLSSCPAECKKDYEEYGSKVLEAI